MRFVIAVALIAATRFSLTPFAPAAKAWLMWPLAVDSKPVLAGLGGLLSQSGSAFSPTRAGIARLGFIAAVLALFGIVVPAEW